MSIEVRFREGVAGVVALAVAVAGTIAAILVSPWWWIVVPPAVAGAFRLERNEGRRRIAATVAFAVILWASQRAWIVDAVWTPRGADPLPDPAGGGGTG